MTRELMTLTLAAIAINFAAADTRAEEPMIGHMVFFKLKDATEENSEKLVTACKKYLTDHPGTVFFAAGPRGKQFDREVNKQDWDVALHLVFENQAAHDTYQGADRHLKFIEENRELWSGVQVFDSEIPPGLVKVKD